MTTAREREKLVSHRLKMRGSYYVARNFSEQLKDLSKEENYNKLKKVYSIWIVSNSSKPEIVKYSFINEKTRTIDPKNAPFCLIMIYLGKQKTKEKVIQYIKALFERAMEYLKKYYIINEEMERSMESMRNLSQGIREEGREEGILFAARKMIEKGTSYEDVAKILDLSEKVIRNYMEEEVLEHTKK